MGSILYFAKDRGRLMSGHSDGTEYGLDVNFERDELDEERDQTTTKSLSGNTFTQLRRIDSTLTLTTSWITNTTTYAQMLEFLSSVSGGELFEVDPYGTLAAPEETFFCTLEGNYKRVRHGTMPIFKITFTVTFNPADTVIA